MPELPEVETIIRGLRPALVDSIIQGAQVAWLRSLAAPTLAQFIERIAGQPILRIERRGKFIWISLPHLALLIHLRMSGDLRLDCGQPTPLAHDRVTFELSGARRLVFNDPRKFGRVWLVEDPGEVLSGLGPEPFDPLLTAERFHRLLQDHNRKLKPLLLDQTFLAGLGNIYTDESLHLARLHPQNQSSHVTPAQAQNLLNAIQMILQQAILRNGSSIDWVYRGGDFQNQFRVYQRTGQPCPVCQAKVERMIVGQRGTHFCPVCQPLVL